MKIISLFLILFFLMFSCTSEFENPEEMNLKISLHGNPQCNGLKSTERLSETPTSQSCVEFVFERDNRKLILKHLNAGFNCCPESLWCTVVYRNDTIVVQEFEKNMGCKCNCLYNLDIEVDGIEPGNFVMQFIEPYAVNQEKLSFEIDLRNNAEGSFCASRTNYPWGE